MNIAFVTMVYNEPVFLDIWVRYYARFVDRSQLIIVKHGEDQDYVDDIAKGCRIETCPRDARNPNLDRHRFDWMSAFCSEKLGEFDRVVFNDVDEVIVLDPNIGDSPVSYLAAIPPSVEVVTPFGLEVVHQVLLENDFDFGRGLFQQRRFVRASGLYSKPCITNTPIIWGPDGHGCSHDKLYLDENLYLFHLKWFDDAYQYERFQERINMRFKNHRGTWVAPGAGTWHWDEQAYRRAVNAMMAAGIDPHGEEFDWSRLRTHLRESFRGGNGRYRLAGFTDKVIRRLPDRFIPLL